MPYCENCGSEISPTAKFCNNCGAVLSNASAASPANTPASMSTQPIQQPPYPAANAIPVQTQTPNASAESVLGVLALRKPKSLGRYDSFTGVLTNQRIIFAQTTSEMLKQASQTAKEQAKAEGKGF